MTRKDYEMLAEEIRAELKVWTGVPYSLPRRRVLESVAARIGNRLAAENPRFDVPRFMADCGFPQDGQNGQDTSNEGA